MKMLLTAIFLVALAHQAPAPATAADPFIIAVAATAPMGTRLIPPDLLESVQQITEAMNRGTRARAVSLHADTPIDFFLVVRERTTTADRGKVRVLLIADRDNVWFDGACDVTTDDWEPCAAAIAKKLDGWLDANRFVLHERRAKPTP